MAKRLVIVAILLLAVGLRFYRLDAQSLWNDEGNSARLSERSIRLIIEGTASDIHPPLYYLCLRAWRELVGEHEFGLRSFSAFLGVSTVAVTVALAGAIGGRRISLAAMLAGLIAAVSPALVYYSQETRMYVLLAFVSGLSSLLFVSWLQDRQGRGVTIAYAASAAVGLYTHYFFPALLLVHNLIVLGDLLGVTMTSSSGTTTRRLRLPWSDGGMGSRLQMGLKWLGMMIAVMLLYLPWLPIFLRQAGDREVVQANLAEFVRRIGSWLVYGATIEPSIEAWLAVSPLLLVIAGIVIGGRKSALPLVGLALPALLMFAAGTTGPEFHKFMLISVPFLAILMSNGWAGGSRSNAWLQALLLIPLLALIWGSGRSLRNMYVEPAYERADYRGMAARIEAEGRQNAGIVLSAPNQWEVFTYYHQQGAPVYPIPMGRLTQEEIAAELAQIAARHDFLYAIFWGELQQDPEGIVEEWLDENTFRATDEWVGDVRFVTYATASEMATAMERSLDVLFGDQIKLNGYSLMSDTLARGDILQLTLFWQATDALTQRYKVFLHLVGDDGRIMAQQDAEPGGGSLPTTEWIPGEPVSDNHALLIPVHATPGEYRLLLGLYELTDPTARLLAQTDVEMLDALNLTMISIE